MAPDLLRSTDGPRHGERVKTIVEFPYLAVSQAPAMHPCGTKFAGSGRIVSGVVPGHPNPLAILDIAFRRELGDGEAGAQRCKKSTNRRRALMRPGVGKGRRGLPQAAPARRGLPAEQAP